MAHYEEQVHHKTDRLKSTEMQRVKKYILLLADSEIQRELEVMLMLQERNQDRGGVSRKRV